MSAEANVLDEAVLIPYLEREVSGFKGFKGLKKFSGGQSNPTYKLSAESGEYVLRAKPPGQLLKSAHQIDREFKVMKALQGTGVPVPRMLYISGEGDESPIGRMFYVMDFVPGRTFWDPAIPEVSTEDRTQIYDSMNATLAALHNVDVEAVGLGDYGKPGNYFERQFSRWSSQYRASETSEVKAMDELIAWLEKNLPADDGTVSLVHGDFRLDNMLIAPDAPKVVTLLDWELSTLGHPFADISYQCMQWRLPHDPVSRGLTGVDRKSIGIPTEEEYVETYCKRRNITGIDNWNFYLAFSFFRLAAILQGVYKRALDGNASDEKAKTYGASVNILADQAVTLIGKA